MKNPNGHREDRIDRIEAVIERIEVALEKSVHLTDVRFQKMSEAQVLLMETQNSTWARIEAVNKDLAESIKETDEKLNILIDTIDRMIHRQSRKNGKNRKRD